jgi:Aspartyl protease
MFDAIDLGQVPVGPAAVGAYVDGNWPTAEDAASRFPHAHLLTIAVSADHDAEALDVETGDAKPDDAPGWVGRQHPRVQKPCLYASVDLMQSKVIPALQAAGIPRAAVRLWTAHYAGKHICGPLTCGELSADADGTQWTDQAFGRDLDQSLLVADFFGTPKPAAARKKAAPVTSVPIEILNDSVVIHATANGQPVSFVLDTGDAIGPVFTADDAQRLGLQQGAPFGVEGAGGSSSVYQTTASITFDDLAYPDEPSAIDLDLQGDSLLGLPWFLARCESFTVALAARQLSLVPLPAKA